MQHPRRRSQSKNAAAKRSRAPRFLLLALLFALPFPACFCGDIAGPDAAGDGDGDGDGDGERPDGGVGEPDAGSPDGGANSGGDGDGDGDGADGGVAGADGGSADGGSDGDICGDGAVSGEEVCDDGVNDGSYGGCETGCTGLAPYCGDGTLDVPTEVCDDGVNDDGYDSCTADCQGRAAYCGDGAVDFADGEACDDSTNDGAYEGCAPGCMALAAYCGDAQTDSDDGESCDDGVNDGAYGGCLADCSADAPRCGDGVVDDVEGCDDGVNEGAYGSCESDCLSRAPFCGDGNTDSAFGESCDDGVNDGTNGCPPGCGLDSFCGDNVVDTILGEVCDDGVNDGGYGGCSAGCLALAPYCGDNAVTFSYGELCDDGINDGAYGGCNSDCQSRAAYCGDNNTDPGETCDDGVNSGAYGGCNSDCQSLAAYCGDNNTDPGEACDDGVNDGAYGGCNSDCQSRAPYCGDNNTDPGETCDDGVNDGAYGGCNADCQSRAAYCGDNNTDPGEACDDGVNDGAYGGCSSDCQSLAPYCGDNNTDPGETCDDGVNDGAYGGCNSDCQSLAAYCGDNNTDPGETCDDGVNDGAYGGCNADCQSLAAYCGDNNTDPGETCDDGVNDGAYGGCNNDCLSLAAYCGDNNIDPGETCDDGVNDGAYDGCQSDCLARAPYCGDNNLDFAAGEVCDDGVNDGGFGECNPGCGSLAPQATLLITEVMYNPPKEDDYVDNHEFVEIHNPESAVVDLEGWSLSGGIDFAFSPGTTIAAGAYLVVAKNRTALLAVPTYALAAGQVVGDYERSLGNGGDDVALNRPNATVSDEMEYDDDFPWPQAADSLGASSEWLDPALLPVSGHKFLGYSLERVANDVSAANLENWVASALDAATPGAANTMALAVPLDVVADIDVGPDTPMSFPSRIIFDTDDIRVEVEFTNQSPLAGVTLEYFIDDLNATGEATTSVALLDDGMGSDTVAGDRIYTAVLGPQTEEDIIRYRVRGDRGNGDEVISPRASDPYDWHAMYISPVINESTRTYEIFIGTQPWTEMHQNIDSGRVNGCAERPEWNEREVGVFVFEGHVWDTRVRYQGSRYQRNNGKCVGTGPDNNCVEVWPYPGPDAPDPLYAYSWRVAFPRYDRFNGRKVIFLNKMEQSCAGLEAGVGFDLFAQHDVPAPKNVRYARMRVNGGYYNYALELDRMGEVMLEKYHEDQAQKYGTAEDELGHLFKVKGLFGEEGPWNRGDGRELDYSYGCDADYTPEERYAATFDRTTHEWDDHAEFIAFVEALNAVDASDRVAVRAFVDANFDVTKMLNYLTVRQFSSPWDDTIHNYFIYQNRADQKWSLFGWDMDLSFGRSSRSRWYGSLYAGERGNVWNQGGVNGPNRFKDIFIKAYRGELKNAMIAASTTSLDPALTQPLVDAFHATADWTDGANAGARVACNTTGARNTIYNFMQERADYIAAQLPAPANSLEVAINQTAVASSEWPDLLASAAINGAEHNQGGNNALYHSGEDDFAPWWRVDLGSEMPVNAVQISTRVDCCTDRDYNISVEVLDAGLNVVYTHPVLNPWDGTGAAPVGGQPSRFDVDLTASPQTGRYVRVSKAGFNGSEYLQLTHVEVYTPLP